MIDRSGNTLTDAKRSAEGSLLPIGGYKGYGLALVFGLLAGTLNGAAMARSVVDFNADDRTPTNTGQAIMALDIARFGPVEEFKCNVDAVIRDMRGSERLPGVAAIRVPGEQSHCQMVERSASGIPIRAALLGALSKLSVDLAIAPLDVR